MVGSCSLPEEPPSATAAATVSIETVALHPMRSVFEAGGVVAARTSAAVASRIVATVLSVEVEPGDRVAAGERLVVLDGRDLDARRAQAASSLAALARAAAVAVADRDAATAALEMTRVTYDRIVALHARRSATPHELDEATAALRSAEARLRAAEARMAEADEARAGAQAAMTAATVTAGFAVLTAPFDGVVSEKLTEPGNLAAVGVPLLRVEDTRGFTLDVRIDESRAGRVAVGDPVEVLLGASPSAAAALAGRVREMSRAADAASHAFLVKVALPPDARLRSGAFARARFNAGAREALAVPAEAIVPQGQLSTLFVVSADGRARMRVVRTGQADEDRVEVVAGLTAGERVIVGPPPALRDGDPVRPADRVASAGDGGS
jgi:RND family efflux transporter MFP subunit